MLTGVRVKKHPDHRNMTLFRLFLDGELINSIRVDDCLADELERLLTPAAPVSRRKRNIWGFIETTLRDWRSGKLAGR